MPEMQPQTGTQYPTVAVPQKWPMVTNIESRDFGGNNQYAPGDGIPSKDGRIVNGFAEQNTSTGEWFIQKRPGYQSALATYTQKSGTGNGIYAWQGSLYSVFGGNLYRDNVLLGAVNSSAPYFFSEILSSPTRYLTLGNGSAAYFTDGTVLNTIIDPDFPANFAGGWAYLDGTLYVLDFNAVIHGSDINNPGLWSALNIITANNYPGDGRALAKQLAYVIAMKEFNTEVFYDAGNATGSPLGRVPGALFPYGCVDPDTVVEIDGVLIWLAANRDAEPRVVRLDNLTLQVISTSPVNRILGGITTNVFRAFSFKMSGHRFYVLKCQFLNFTLVYDLDQNLWYEWTAPNGFSDWPIVAATRLANDTIIQHQSNGQVYFARPDYREPTDVGSVFSVDIYTPNFTAGVYARSKNLRQITFETDYLGSYGVTADFTGYQEGTTNTLLVRSNDYDYAYDKWSNFRRVNLTSRKPSLNNEGSFYRRAYHLRYTAPTSFRISNMHLQMDLGTL